MATILIVDDLAADRDSLLTLLRSQGHRALAAADGREALAAAHSEHPDLVITDVPMPLMDGYELVRQLRLDPATSRIPVVVLTARGGEGDARVVARSYGVDDVLSKPAEPAEVLKIVGRALAGQLEIGAPSAACASTPEFDRQCLPTDTDPKPAEDLRTANTRLRALIDLGLVRYEALRTAEERMRIALENANVGIWDLDYVTGTLRWSETIEIQYGLQPGTFAGTIAAFVERVHPDDRAMVLETFTSAAKSGVDFCVDHRSMRPDGTVRWLSSAGRVQLGEHGEPLRGVGTSLDVTGRRALEEQYLQAQKMEAVGLLAGGVAHDFNNLLTEILGHCELLLADLDSGDTRQADIAEIQKAGARAAGLTRQLMAYSRKEIIEPTVLDLNGVVAGMRGMLGRLIGENVKVVLSLRPELARVKADHGQIEQILMNLAVNARDAMPRGGTLRIETANIELDDTDARTSGSVKPGPYVALTVADTGTGMTAQVQARLFEPFFTTKGRDEGTGLGLATVDGIVRRSGGAIDVLSEVGRGTSFTVYFPKTCDEAMAVAAPPPVDHSPARAHTVLVVDDAAALCELTKRLLQRLGYTVLIAASADEALRVFEQNAAIDVLLTDVVMPGTSGPELTKELVRQRPALKVIYMSGYTAAAIAQHGVTGPGIAFLHKPFTSATLGGKIREVMGQ